MPSCSDTDKYVEDGILFPNSDHAHGGDDADQADYAVRAVDVRERVVASLACEMAPRLDAVKESIELACARAGRSPGDVCLVGVSKFQPAEAILAAQTLGLHDFGENRAQELLDKLAVLGSDEEKHRWHFIGQLQTNKVNDVVGRVTLIHSADRVRLLKRLQKRAEVLKLQQPILLQVNVTGEVQKSGFAPEVLPEVIGSFAEDYPNLKLHGLMTMAEYGADEKRLRDTFSQLRELRDALRASLPTEEAKDFKELSMGMSGDFAEAIAEGATLIRVGTAIFGQRTQ